MFIQEYGCNSVNTQYRFHRNPHLGHEEETSHAGCQQVHREVDAHNHQRLLLA